MNNQETTNPKSSKCKCYWKPDDIDIKVADYVVKPVKNVEIIQLKILKKIEKNIMLLLCVVVVMIIIKEIIKDILQINDIKIGLKIKNTI